MRALDYQQAYSPPDSLAPTPLIRRCTPRCAAASTTCLAHPWVPLDGIRRRGKAAEEGDNVSDVSRVNLGLLAVIHHARLRWRGPGSGIAKVCRRVSNDSNGGVRVCL